MAELTIESLSSRVEELEAELAIQTTLTERNRESDSAKFDRFAREWKSAGIIASSAEKLAMHPAYQRIIGIGPQAIPLILAELEKEPRHWFWALRAITDTNPVKEEHRGNVRKMAQDWLEWARNNGIQWNRQ